MEVGEPTYHLAVIGYGVVAVEVAEDEKVQFEKPPGTTPGPDTVATMPS